MTQPYVHIRPPTKHHNSIRTQDLSLSISVNIGYLQSRQFKCLCRPILLFPGLVLRSHKTAYGLQYQQTSHLPLSSLLRRRADFPIVIRLSTLTVVLITLLLFLIFNCLKEKLLLLLLRQLFILTFFRPEKTFPP